MANSTFAIAIGKGSNPRMVRGFKSGRILHAWSPWLWYRQIVRVGDFVGAAATSQAIDLHVYNPNNLFPANVLRGPAVLKLSRDFAGGAVSAATGEIGDAGAGTGLMTAQSIFTGAKAALIDPDPGYLPSTVGAGEYAERVEPAFIPQFTIRTTTANVVALTAGEAEIFIGWRPLPA